MSETHVAQRDSLLRKGMLLSAAVVVWNVAEGILAVGSGLIADSVALISFGIDSFIEVASAVVVWIRLRREVSQTSAESIEEIERRAARVTGALLLLLAVYVLIDAGGRLLGYGEEAAISPIGMVLTGISLLVMPLLGWSKLKTAGELNSKSMRADAFETIACAWLSLATLTGLSLNAAFAWSWADPMAALAILPLVVHEGLAGFQQESNDE